MKFVYLLPIALLINKVASAQVLKSETDPQTGKDPFSCS